MEVDDIRRLFDDVERGYVDTWPDLRLLSKLVLLSSGGCLSGHLAIRWHDLDKEDHASCRLFPGPRIPGFPCAGHGQGKTNPFCFLMWDEGWDASACGFDKLRAEQTTMKTRQPHVYECHAGLTDIAVPVCAGDTYVGTIVTGQVHRTPPTKRKFEAIRRRLQSLTYLDMDRLYEAYMATPVISEEKLQSTVNMLMIIADHVARLWIKTERLLEQERRFERIRTYERRELVEELVSGRSLDLTKTAERLQQFGLDRFPTTTLVIRITNLETMTSGEPQSRREILFDRAVNKLQDVIERIPGTLGAAQALGEITILAAPPKKAAGEAAKLMLREIGERALDMLQKNAGLTAVVGIGRVYDSPAALHQSYQEALEAALRNGDGDSQPHRVVHIDDLAPKNRRPDGVFWRLQENFCAAFKKGDSATTLDTLGEMFSWLRANGHTTVEQQRPFLVSLVERLMGEAIEAGYDRSRILERKSQWFEHLLLANSTDELRRWFDTIIEELLGEIRTIHMDRMSKLVAVATACMEDNRTNRLSLEEVAKRVGLSPWYFRRKFREIQGVGFKHYQMQVRMREASRLLLDPGLSITEVAMALGYNGASQFARVFRKYIGISPREYRANPRMENESLRFNPHD